VKKSETETVPTKLPKTVRISMITLLVHDQDEAVAFYSGHLGFKVTKDIKYTDESGSCRWLTIQAPGQEDVQITVIKAEKDEDKAIVGKQSGSTPFLVIDSDDVNADFNRLSGLGVEFVQKPTDRFYGVESLLKDPAGNVINLIQPKDH